MVQQVFVPPPFQAINGDTASDIAKMIWKIPQRLLRCLKV